MPPSRSSVTLPPCAGSTLALIAIDDASPVVLVGMPPPRPVAVKRPGAVEVVEPLVVLSAKVVIRLEAIWSSWFW